MPMLQNEQTTIEVADDGYLLRPDEWDENVA
jgi:sulfur relay (sulfurtransferase) DsrC/TusE family protein